MAKNYVAVGTHVFVVRDEAATERNGLTLSDQAVKKPNTGKIVSVGKSVQDANIKEGRDAIWNSHVGFDIDLDEVVITVLREHEILGLS